MTRGAKYFNVAHRKKLFIIWSHKNSKQHDKKEIIQNLMFIISEEPFIFKTC